MKTNIRRITKKSKKGNASLRVELSKSCDNYKNYEDYFFSSARKIDYSNIFFNNLEFSNFSVTEKDEIFEESPESKSKSSPRQIIAESKKSEKSPTEILGEKFGFTLNIQKEESTEINEI